jgi:hypothetical protein
VKLPQSLPQVSVNDDAQLSSNGVGSGANKYYKTTPATLPWFDIVMPSAPRLPLLGRVGASLARVADADRRNDRTTSNVDCPNPASGTLSIHFSENSSLARVLCYRFNIYIARAFPTQHFRGTPGRNPIARGGRAKARPPFFIAFGSHCKTPRMLGAILSTRCDERTFCWARGRRS